MLGWREWQVSCDANPMDRRTVDHVTVQHTQSPRSIEVDVGDGCAVLTARQALDLAALLVCCAHGWNRAEVHPWLYAASQIPQTGGSPLSATIPRKPRGARDARGLTNTNGA